MIRYVINEPKREKRFVASGNFEGVKVVGGAEPTGKLPYTIGSGVFGRADEHDGIFGERQYPPNAQGIFFNPYPRSNLELQQPSTKWVLLRRPGQPLFPGSDSRGIVLIGPSMGGLSNPGMPGASGGGHSLLSIAAGVAAGALAFKYLVKPWLEQKATPRIEDRFRR
jgi:hypothetical protein